MTTKTFLQTNRMASVVLGLLAAYGAPAWGQDKAATFPIASPEQVAAALDDCIKTDGMPGKLETAGWNAGPPSGGGATVYRKAGNGAMMPLFNPNGEVRCWVMSKTDQPSARYVEAITALLGPPTRKPSQSSDAQTGDLDQAFQWNVKGYAIPMDVFKTPQPGVRIEVWRLQPRPQK